MKQIKPLYFVLCLMAGICMLSGCIEEYEADIPSEESNLLVVEGTICSSRMNKFVLSRSQPVNTSYTPQLVLGASVSVRGTDGSVYPTELTDGYYSCWIDALDPNVEYYLHIETEGEIYESEPQNPLPTEKIAKVSGIQYTPESNIDVLVTPETPFDPSKTNYYSWSYDETWEVHPDYTTVIYFDTRLRAPVYKPDLFPTRGWKTVASSTINVSATSGYEGHHIQSLKLYDIDRGDERMYYRYSGLVHQRAISKGEYEYELARQQASTEMGGLFTPLPSALPTNIHCLNSKKRVIGYVGCSLNTGEYRFFLDRVDYSIDQPYRKDSRIWLDDCDEEDCYRMVVKENLFLCEWKDERYKPAGTLQTAWAYEHQLDVRLRGAYAEEPVFWSLKVDGAEY